MPINEYCKIISIDIKVKVFIIQESSARNMSIAAIVQYKAITITQVSRMKPSHLGIIVSTVLHLILLGLSIIIKIEERKQTQEISVEFISKKRTQPSRVPGIVARPEIKSRTDESTLLSSIPVSIADSQMNESQPTMPEDTMLFDADFLLQKYLFTHDLGDSLPLQKSTTPLDLGEPLPPYYFDRIEQDINKKNTGTGKPFMLGDLLRAGVKYLKQEEKKKNSVRLDFIPSDVEVAIFKAIWQKENITDQDIYSSLDSTLLITAADLNRTLEVMTRKGLLSRKLVSPRNEFTVMGAAIEMSAKNRRNRVYAYQSRVSSEHMIQFLQAALYQVENRQKIYLRRPVGTDDSAVYIRDKIVKIVTP